MVNNKKDNPKLVISHDIKLDSDYIQWINTLKSRFHKAQIKSAIKVNSEQLIFNWQLGRDLVERKAEDKWGSGIVEQVSLDLQKEFPNIKGFSARNLWNMKKWYSFYSSYEGIEETIINIDKEIDTESLLLK